MPNVNSDDMRQECKRNGLMGVWGPYHHESDDAMDAREHVCDNVVRAKMPRRLYHDDPDLQRLQSDEWLRGEGRPWLWKTAARYGDAQLFFALVRFLVIDSQNDRVPEPRVLPTGAPRTWIVKVRDELVEELEHFAEWRPEWKHPFRRRKALRVELALLERFLRARPVRASV